MATLGEMKAAIARRLKDDSNTAITAVEIVEAINSAVKKWKMKRFWFNQTSAPLSIAAGDDELTLPSDFLIDLPRNAFTVTDNGFPYQVAKRIPVVFDQNVSTTFTGLPRIYTYRGGAIEFSPIADKDYAGTLYYLKDYDSFATDGSADDQDNDFLVEADDLIRAEALSNLQGDIKEDDDRVEYYEKRTQQAFTELLSRTNKLNASGSLTVQGV
jgi:hypothetical protein